MLEIFEPVTICDQFTTTCHYVLFLCHYIFTSGLSTIIISECSTCNNRYIFIKLSTSDGLQVVHHFDIVVWSLPSCSASHLPVFFSSRSRGLYHDICRLAARYLGFYQEDVSFPLNILFSDRYFGKIAYFCNMNSKRSNYGIEIISCRNPNI